MKRARLASGVDSSNSNHSAHLDSRIARLSAGLSFSHTGHQTTVERLAANAEEVLAEDRFNLTAWGFLLLRATAQFPLLDSGRVVLDRFLETFPLAASVWRLYLELETAAGEWARAERIIVNSLQQCLDVALCDAYVSFVARRYEQSGELEPIKDAFCFVLRLVGDNADAMPLWWRYLDFLEATPQTTAEDRDIVRKLVLAASSEALHLPILGLPALANRRTRFLGHPDDDIALKIARRNAEEEVSRRWRFVSGAGLPSSAARLLLPESASSSSARERAPPRHWRAGPVGRVIAPSPVLARPTAETPLPLPPLLARFAAFADRFRLGSTRVSQDAALAAVLDTPAAATTAASAGGQRPVVPEPEPLLPGASVEGLVPALLTAAEPAHVGAWLAYVHHERENTLQLDSPLLHARVANALQRARAVCGQSVEFWRVFATAALQAEQPALSLAPVPAAAARGTESRAGTDAAAASAAGAAGGAAGAAAAAVAVGARDCFAKPPTVAAVWGEAARAMPHSLLLRLTHADFLEDSGATDAAAAVYAAALATERVAATVAKLAAAAGGEFALAPPEDAAAARRAAVSAAAAAAVAANGAVHAVVDRVCETLRLVTADEVADTLRRAVDAGAVSSEDADAVRRYHDVVVVRGKLLFSATAAVSATPTASSSSSSADAVPTTARSAIGANGEPLALGVSVSKLLAGVKPNVAAPVSYDFGPPAQTPPLMYIAAMRFQKRYRGIRAARDVYEVRFHA